MRVAAVDIGSNSARLLVAEGDGGGFTTLDRLVTITRLGQDVDATGRLADAAIERTVRAVIGYAEVWRAHDVGAVRITATSAARDSVNAADFAAAVRAVAGVAPEVLSGEEEAATSFKGALSGLPGTPLPAVVLDIGGGSTELVIGSDRPERSTSRQLGCVRLTERALRTAGTGSAPATPRPTSAPPPTAAQIAQAEVLVQHELDAVEALVGPASGAALVAVAGTATTLAALHLDLARYEPGVVHGTSVPATALRRLADRLLAMHSQEIGALGPVEGGREDVLAAGALILAAVAERFGFESVVISETDILDGLVLGLLQDTA